MLPKKVPVKILTQDYEPFTFLSGMKRKPTQILEHESV
jgi:hypothetical protein